MGRKVLTEEERKEKNREKARKWYESHKEEIKERDRENHRRWYESHKEEQAGYMRKWYESHKEEIKERNRENSRNYYESHKEEIKERNRENSRNYYESHKEERAGYMRKWYELHKEDVKEYRVAHNEEITKKNKWYYQTLEGRVRHLLGAYRKFDEERGFGGQTLSFEDAIELLKDASCHYCDKGNWMVLGLDRLDSSLPHSKDNCVACCLSCNAKKGKKSEQEFYDYLEKEKREKEERLTSPKIKKVDYLSELHLSMNEIPD